MGGVSIRDHRLKVVQHTPHKNTHTHYNKMRRKEQGQLLKVDVTMYLFIRTLLDYTLFLV